MAAEWSDDDLLAALGAALAEADTVPPAIAQAGRDVYGWRTIDAELSALSYDSAADPELPVLVRGGRAARRSLSFDTARLRIDVDLEYDPDALRGQVSAQPPSTGVPGQLFVERVGADLLTTEIDEVGYFSIEPFPAAPGAFRLRCGDVVTPWIS